MARNFGSGARMRKSWTQILSTQAAITTDGTLGAGVIDFSVPTTVLRMIGEYGVTPTSSPVAGDDMIFTCAIGVVSTDASTLGATALPDPTNEPEYPWLYYGSHGMFFPGTEADPSSTGGSFRQSFDVHSMRKIKPRESLAMIIQSSSTGAPPIRFYAGVTRVLVGT